MQKDIRSKRKNMGLGIECSQSLITNQQRDLADSFSSVGPLSLQLTPLPRCGLLHCRNRKEQRRAIGNQRASRSLSALVFPLAKMKILTVTHAQNFWDN